MKTAYTTEIDDVDDAWESLASQIDFGGLKKNSAGIVSCCYDFVESGAVRGLCGRLPFPTVGMTSLANANSSGFDEYGLSLTVITSDDVTFEAACTEPLSRDNHARNIGSAYRSARDRLPGDPVFIITFFPYLRDLSEPDILNSFDAACGSLPIWGSVASGVDMTYEHARTIYGGEDSEKSVVMLLVHGDVDPDFINASIPEQNIRESKVEITKSDGCVLQEVNDITVTKYMESIGLVLREEDSTATPVMVDYGDGSKPVAVAIYHINEDGGILCGGEMPLGASIATGEVDAEGVMQTTHEGIDKILRCGRRNGMLAFPCIIRYLMLAPHQDEEIKALAERMGDLMPYSLGYSGGEICPSRDRDRKWRNRFHNYTFSACVF
jgi:hypothetical protein